MLTRACTLGKPMRTALDSIPQTLCPCVIQRDAELLMALTLAKVLKLIRGNIEFSSLIQTKATLEAAAFLLPNSSECLHDR